MSPTVIYPTTFQEVSDAVLLAQAEKKELAVTSGAHHNTSGASYTESGVLIDLSKLNAVRIDADERVAYVQGGARFRQVEEEAIKFGLAMPAGTVSDIGVAGLTTGGGYGWLSGMHGLVIDNLLSATVVVASGAILTASHSENADLFWGIRGGGSNFGIVVEFVFRLHQQRSDIYTTSLTFAGELLPVVVQQINRWTRKQTPDEAGCLTFFTEKESGKTMLEWFGVKSADDVAGQAAFKDFVELGPSKNVSGMVAYENLNTMMDKYIVPGVGNRLHSGQTLGRLDLKPFKKAFEAFSNLGDTAIEHSNVKFDFYHFDKIASVPIEETAFAQRAPVYNVLIAVQWATPSPTFDAASAAQTIANKIALATGNTEVGYANYADQLATDNGDEHARKVFGVNYERMRLVKKTYDPTRVFNKWFPVTPAQ